MKKINPSLLGLIISAFFAIGCYFIYQYFIAKKSEHIVDNNSTNFLKIKIDNKTYSIAPQQNISIHLPIGKHNLIVKNEKDSILEQTDFEVKKSRGLINLNRKPYFIFSLPYGPKINTDSIFKNNFTTYGDKKYYGILDIDSALYMENFYYNINESFPSITISSQNSNLRSKIFREDDFKQFYFEKFE